MFFSNKSHFSLMFKSSIFNSLTYEQTMKSTTPVRPVRLRLSYSHTHIQDTSFSVFSLVRVIPKKHIVSFFLSFLFFWHVLHIILFCLLRISCFFGWVSWGKTTQLPQFLLDDWANDTTDGTPRIVVTQPRRIAAITVATRVAWERNSQLGDVVGYSVHGVPWLWENPGILGEKLGKRKMLV